MYVVETHSSHEVHGTPEELQSTKLYATSLIIAALRISLVNVEQADSLLSDFWENRGDMPIIVWRNSTYSDAFTTIFTQPADFAEPRHKQLLMDAAEGKISALDVAREVELLRSYESAALDPVNCMWVNENGLGLMVLPGLAVVDADEIEPAVRIGRINDCNASLADSLPVTHFAYQHELEKRGEGYWHQISDYVHLSLGSLDNSGKYVAYASILDQRHPAISGNFGSGTYDPTLYKQIEPKLY